MKQKTIRISEEEIDFITNALVFTCEEGYSQDKEWQKKADKIASKLREDQEQTNEHRKYRYSTHSCF